MRFIVEPSTLKGQAPIPASKSHTIRALFLAMLARGRSEILSPLRARDTEAAAAACRAFGARITDISGDTGWTIEGTVGQPVAPQHTIDVMNSGTTLPIAMSTAALTGGAVTLTGDEQIQRRPVRPLADALIALGARVQCAGDCPPVTVTGPLLGGRAPLRAPASQYLTSLLINAPFAQADTEIDVLELNEAPYVAMTLNWLDRLGLRYENHDMKYFRIPGGQSCDGFRARVPADFSSATFFLVAAAVTGGELVLEGLDMNDTQGDKAVIEMLRAMGARIDEIPEGLRVRGGALRGCDFDLNATPDALPSLAVAGCCAEGTTRLLNVPQARIKETDRIRVMREELTRLGARAEELPHGLVVHGGPLTGATVNGHHDHRVVMALAVAGLVARGRTVIETAEATNVTFPNFPDLMRAAGASLSVE